MAFAGHNETDSMPAVWAILASIGLAHWAQGIAVLVAWAAALWATLRFGLPPADKAALGKVGRKLRLA